MEKTHCSTTVMCYFSHTSCRLSPDHGRIMPRNMPVAVLFRCTTKLQLQMHFQLSIAPVSVKLTVESFCHISCCFCGDAVRISCDYQFILLPFFSFHVVVSNCAVSTLPFLKSFIWMLIECVDIS